MSQYEDLSILLVEDDIGLQTLIKKRLSRQGFNVNIVSAAEEFLDNFENLKPDLMLLDYTLPQMSSISLILEIRKRKTDIPFIIITGNEDRETAVEMMRLGARDYLVKDDTFLDLLPSVVENNINQLQTEEELTDSREKFRTFIESVDDMVYFRAINGNFTMLNFSNERITGYSSELFEADHNLWKEIIHPDDRHLEELFFSEPPKEVESFIVEYRLKTKYGDWKWIQSKMTSVKDKNKNHIGYNCIDRDISELKRANEELKNLSMELEKRVVQRTAQLKVANKELESFTYSVSHDLRAPLRGIIGFSEMLVDEYGNNFDEKGKDLLSRVKRAGLRMRDLIESLLELSRLTRNKLILEDVDITMLSKIISSDLKESDPKRKTVFEIEEELKCIGDKRMLQTLLENLLGNAWKFTSNKVNSKISVSKIESEFGPAFLIEDNGVGFNMKNIEKIFRAFTRLHADSEFEGTGIGLATVQRIINRHNGKIWAEAEPNKGAKFFFMLPKQSI